MPFPSLRPLLPAGSAPAPPSLLDASGAFNRAVIMRQAHAEARAHFTRQVALGIKPWRYALRLKHALHAVWSDAKALAQIACEDARLGVMPAAVANLIRERAIALHIDSLPAMSAELAAISARAAALGVRL